jgi:hypothetical protein
MRARVRCVAAAVLPCKTTQFCALGNGEFLSGVLPIEEGFHAIGQPGRDACYHVVLLSLRVVEVLIFGRQAQCRACQKNVWTDRRATSMRPPTRPPTSRP